MTREKITLNHSETCDSCQKPILAGEPVYPLYNTNIEQPNIPMEEIRTDWILSFCFDCIDKVNQQRNE